ncbi:hypothetical protein K505DRAFT_358934 [Melanomma pulvis-pyrius CBS 109.77]|uniref:EGF-like domain-containing protein n=1 Tax=Melanomma pulvis-pyrius CBS 109.77 TaxID=1314802 RepID=A0A6A6XL35_9PLEO|nr:hypothetical protein K505DRAFT_358934 [Melanomma pulvis-pyrius CBS 109.77]
MKLLAFVGVVLTGLATVGVGVPFNEHALANANTLGTGVTRSNALNSVKAVKIRNSAPLAVTTPQKRDDSDKVEKADSNPNRTFCFYDHSGYWLCIKGMCAPRESCTPQGKICMYGPHGAQCVPNRVAEALLEAGCTSSCKCQCRGNDDKDKGGMYCPCSEEFSRPSIERTIEDSQEPDVEGSVPTVDVPAFATFSTVNSTAVALNTETAGDCNIGDRICYANDGYVVVCNDQKKWLVERRCKNQHCCAVSDLGQPYCACGEEPLTDGYDVPSDGGSHAKCAPVGASTCSTSGRWISKCNSDGSWKETFLCSHHCIFNRHGEAICGVPENPWKIAPQNNPDYSQPEGCSEGQSHCGVNPLDNSWYILKCDQNSWVESQACSVGQTCSQTKGQDPLCAPQAPNLHSRSPLNEPTLQQSCSNEGKKQCGSDWFGVVCKDGIWKAWLACPKNKKCVQKPGQDPTCAPRLSASSSSDNDKRDTLEPIQIVDRLPKLAIKDLKAIIGEDGSTEVNLNEDESHLSQLLCTPGHYKCGVPYVDHIVVCDQTGHWQFSSDCGGVGCCRTGTIPWTAYCDCRPPPPDRDPPPKRELTPQGLTPPTKGPEALAARLWSGPCLPGTYMCDPWNHREIWICKYDGSEYILSAKCGRRDGCCENGPVTGTAFCICGAGTKGLSLSMSSDRSEEPTTELKAITKRGDSYKLPLPCKPGTYRCSGAWFWILVCNPAGTEWIPSAQCARPGACEEGPVAGTAFCKGGSKLEAGRELSGINDSEELRTAEH